MLTPLRMHYVNEFNEIILKKRYFNYKMQFTGPTGSNAVEAALKLARKVTGRKNICYFSGAYHGLSLGALSVSDLPRQKENIHISFPHTIMASYDMPGASELTLMKLQSMIEQLKVEELPAAFILETIQDGGGIQSASKIWLEGVAALAKQYNILLIVDDIQVGCGRSGCFFSFEPFTISPDLICLSKSVGGCGLPLSVVLFKPEFDLWYASEHESSFSGNNLALLSAQVVLEHWKNDDFQNEILKKAKILNQELQALVDAYPNYPSLVKGRGLIQGLEWRDEKIAPAIAKEAFDKGLIIVTTGPKNAVLKFLPTLTISHEDLFCGIEIIQGCMKKILT